MPRLKIWDSVNNVWQYVDNTNYVTSSLTTASFATSASYALYGPVSCSYADTASYATYGSPNLTAISINYVIDGGGAIFSTVGGKGYLEVPFNMKVTGWTIMADTSGICYVEIRKTTYAGFPPTSGNKISGTDSPALINTQKNQNTTLASWSTTTINSGDILEYYLTGSTGISRLTVSLKGNKI